MENGFQCRFSKFRRASKNRASVRIFLISLCGCRFGPGFVRMKHWRFSNLLRSDGWAEEQQSATQLKATLNLHALASEITGIFAERPHTEPFLPQPADPKVFVAAKARLAKPKTKEEAAALHDMDDASEIRKEVEKSTGKLHRHKDDD